MSVLDRAIGWLAPVDCLGCGEEGQSVCVGCRTAEILPYGQHCAFCGTASPGCRTCLKCRPGAPRHAWVATDYSGLAKEVIRTYKFVHQRTAANNIAEVIAEKIRAHVDQLELAKYVVVHVPTATSRRRQRGFDHAELLARKVAQRLGLKHQPALGRLGQSRQVGLARASRLALSDNKYFARPHLPLKGKNILIIDDVITTGGTLKAVTKTLRQAGARRVDAAVFAKRI